MWLVVNEWSGTSLTGQLTSHPSDVPDLRMGQRVVLDESDVFDWMLQLPRNRQEGGYTSQVAFEEGRSGTP